MEELQESLNNLKQYCNKWNLSVSSENNHMDFRKGEALSRNATWTLDNNEIEIVNNFNYLGVVLSSLDARLQMHLQGQHLRQLIP